MLSTIVWIWSDRTNIVCPIKESRNVGACLGFEGGFFDRMALTTTTDVDLSNSVARIDIGNDWLKYSGKISGNSSRDIVLRRPTGVFRRLYRVYESLLESIMFPKTRRRRHTRQERYVSLPLTPYWRTTPRTFFIGYLYRTIH
jgi:hypothetical protein